MEKQILYIDMDGVTVDYKPSESKNEDGFFLDMPPINNAVASIKKLSKVFDIYFLSTAPWSNPNAWKEKRLWIEKHFGNDFKKRLILTHHKHLNKGDFLIDDRPYANGADKFEGDLIHFGSDLFKDWNSILNYLCFEVIDIPDMAFFYWDKKNKRFKNEEDAVSFFREIRKQTSCANLYDNSGLNLFEVEYYL
ncbi:5' nucleotidase, NT5C type [Flammeovirga kamogawensis]|uniref:Uncharacterized protein n=1 Tax=Flammeovirga kamogawensis TaxID=373891 RepID=A0ABX8H4F8_9BACT|nr:hypothetical protein [Flammeovirga kamogawensis]MBB6463854.1 5'(3')-deoxyribonucleotidase [Flammeovirga kamogawensis]QWG10779.1 hypothetical protein KM029_26835 [Flammeovirga kamogawensis]TRX63235.1 hypothetical protein EO216_26640 [Flammeovirga kamogawensis]